MKRKLSPSVTQIKTKKQQQQKGHQHYVTKLGSTTSKMFSLSGQKLVVITQTTLLPLLVGSTVK